MTQHAPLLKKSLYGSVVAHGLFALTLFVYGFVSKPQEIPIIKPTHNIIEVSFVSESKPEIKTIKKAVVPQPTQKKPTVKSQNFVSLQKPKPIQPRSSKPLQKVFTAQSKKNDAYSPPKKIINHAAEQSVAMKNMTEKNIENIVDKKQISTETNITQQQALSEVTQTVKASQFNKSNYIELVKGKIAAHKFYPMPAKRRGIEGRVGLNLSITESGHIHSMHITQSSGSDILDSAAIECIRNAAPFKAPPQAISFNFGISYSLNEG